MLINLSWAAGRERDYLKNPTDCHVVLWTPRNDVFVKTLRAKAEAVKARFYLMSLSINTIFQNDNYCDLAACECLY
jgi:hypothetical protein